MSNRRKDGELRAAIERVRLNNKNLSNNWEVFSHLLEELLLITHTLKGFILEQHQLPGGAKNIAISHFKNKGIHQLKSNIASVEDKNFKLPFTLIENVANYQRALENTAPRIVKGNELEGYQCPSLHWHIHKQLIILPLIENTNVYAIVCLADGEQHYTEQLAKRLWPLLTTCTCIRRSNDAKVVKGKSIPSPARQNTGVAEIRLKQIESTSFHGMIEINENHKITRFNPAAEEIFAISAANALEQEITTFLPERFPNEHRIQTFPEVVQGDKANRIMNIIARRADDKIISIDIVSSSYRVQGRTFHTLIVQDNSELQLIRREQEEQTQRFKAVSDLAPVGILQTNMQWDCVYVNDRWCEICGFAPEETRGRGWINSIYVDDVHDTLDALRSAMMSGEEFKHECRFQAPIGEILWVELHARPLFTTSGEIDGFLATLSDMTYRHVTEQKLRNLAERDALTGLANRVLFQDRLQHALDRVDRHRAIVLLCLDLDGFKMINDSLGHDAGDMLLKDVAKRVRSCVRNEDTVARIGGDEFIILLEDVQNARFAADISEKILTKLKPAFNVGMQEVFITTSIGITFANSEYNTDCQTLIKQADIALYRAKSAGRNNFQYYSPEMERETKDRLYLGNCLHRALEREEFEVVYQLQAEVRSNFINGTEALLRWRHPERGLLKPSDFIPLLEESGLINQVNAWLIKQALRDHKSWIEKRLINCQSHVSINLAPRQLREQELVRVFATALEDSGLKGHNVVVEITESALLDKSPTTSDILQELQQLGIKIALDDFGTGYSSLTYLKRFPIDLLKIDQTFIRDILSDPDDEAITKAVIALAASMDLTVIAEGVDNIDKLECLKRWGCMSYQGYLLNKPCYNIEIESLLHAHAGRNKLTNFRASP